MNDIPNSIISKAIDEWIHHERNRKILKRRLVDGVLFEVIAEEFDISVQQTKNIVRKGKEIVFKHTEDVK